MRKNFRVTTWAAAIAAGLIGWGCESGSPQASASQGEGGAPTASAGDTPTVDVLASGRWRGSLSTPGGPLTFGLEVVEEDGGGLRAVLINGVERRPAGLIEPTETGIEIAIPPYRSRIVATIESDGSALVGRWERDRGKGMQPTLAFAAVHDASPPKTPPLKDSAVAAITGRWAVDFADDEEPSVGIFEVDRNGRATGTFLTTLGDYRYLAGYSDGHALHLSCFDGAHAFLFAAKIQGDGSLAGDFWSRDSYHDTWTAVKDGAAALPDDFALTEWVGGVPLGDLSFEDPSGEEHALDDPRLGEGARLLVVFGTWCPNCNDLTEYLVELNGRYPTLGIVGLAFEMGDDPALHRQVVREYAEHHGATYPILIGGTADKAAASKAFPWIDRVRAYPTTIFMDASGSVSAVHTGFSGPATGGAHAALKLRFESEIEALMASGK